jgi:hypothetical protein
LVTAIIISAYLCAFPHTLRDWNRCRIAADPPEFYDACLWPAPLVDWLSSEPAGARVPKESTRPL